MKWRGGDAVPAPNELTDAPHVCGKSAQIVTQLSARESKVDSECIQTLLHESQYRNARQHTYALSESAADLAWWLSSVDASQRLLGELLWQATHSNALRKVSQVQMRGRVKVLQHGSVRSKG